MAEHRFDGAAIALGLSNARAVAEGTSFVGRTAAAVRNGGSASGVENLSSERCYLPWWPLVSLCTCVMSSPCDPAGRCSTVTDSPSVTALPCRAGGWVPTQRSDPLAASSVQFHGPEFTTTGVSLPVFTKDSLNLASFSFGHPTRTQNCQRFSLGRVWRGTWHQTRAQVMS